MTVPHGLAEDSGYWWGGGFEVFSSSDDLYSVNQVGYHWESDWRMFLEVGYVESETDLGVANAVLNTDLVPVTLNLVHEFDWTERFSVFLGGGFGGAWIGSEVESVFFRIEEDSFVWAGQVFGGVSYEIWEDAWIDATVRLLSLGEFEVGGVAIDTSADITVGLGIRFGF